MQFDDKIRSTKGVVACIRDMGNGSSRLFFDDVLADKETNPINWSHDYFFTFTPELANSDLDAMSLGSEQYEKIGIALVARLLVLSGRAK